MTRRLVVIGGDAAGMSAASQARRLQGPDELEILAFERGPYTSYSACGIPYWVAGTVEGPEQLIARPPKVFREEQSIDVRTGHEVVGIDLDERSVSVREIDTGRVRHHGYDDLMIATGAAPRRPQIPGIDAPGVFGVQTLEDGERIVDALARPGPGRAVVIGAGYIGVEMAEAMVVRGLRVDVVDRAPQPMSSLDPELGAELAVSMRGMGIGLHLGTGVQGIETAGDGSVRAVRTDDGTIEADLVFLGAGSRPFSDLARDAGVPVGPSGGLVTDRRQRTPLEGVWAAGDCAETFHRVSRRPVSIPLGTIANKQGRIAGMNLGGAYGTFPGVLGTAVTKVCEVELARTGLGAREAATAGFETVTATITSSTRAGYYPGAGGITVKLVAEQVSGRLLGAQIVGREGAAKRIDVLAMALWNEMTVEDLSQVDLAYAPPYSPVWDPVLIAARRTAAAVRG